MTAESPRPTYLAALRLRNFALLFTGQSLSAIGNQMFPVALAVLVLRGGGGVAGLGVVLAVQGVAIAVGTLAAAVVGDRWSRRGTMIVADVLRVVAVATIAVAPALHSLALVVAVFVVGLGEGLFLPAYGAIVSRLLPDQLLQPGNALNNLSIQLAMLLGPALAGVLVGVLGPLFVLWADAATFLVGLATLAALRERPPALEGRATAGLAGALGDFRGGLATIAERPWLAVGIVTVTAVQMLVVAPTLVSLPVVAQERLGGAVAYGAVLASLGLGSILGSFVGGRLTPGRPGLVGQLGMLTMAGSVGALALLPLAPMLALFALAGLGVAVYQVLWVTALQRDVPDHALGRVMALDWLGTQALMPVGYAAAGPLAAVAGVRSVLLAALVFLLVLTPLPLLVPGGTRYATVARAPVPAGGTEP